MAEKETVATKKHGDSAIFPAHDKKGGGKAKNIEKSIMGMVALTQTEGKRTVEQYRSCCPGEKVVGGALVHPAVLRGTRRKRGIKRTRDGHPSAGSDSSDERPWGV